MPILLLFVWGNMIFSRQSYILTLFPKKKKEFQIYSKFYCISKNHMNRALWKYMVCHTISVSHQSCANQTVKMR